MYRVIDDELAIRDEIEQDARDDYDPLDDPDVHIACERCRVRPAVTVLAGVVVCHECQPAELDAWYAEHMTPELIERSLTDLDDVPF